MAATTLLLTVLAGILGALCLASIGYLLFLLVAGMLSRRRAAVVMDGSPLPRFTILIPAHDEELVIGATLASVGALDYPDDKVSVCVIADNCSDTTAAIARAAGATVLERTNATERGKGYALAYAMQHLLAQPNPADAFAIVDADTWVAPDFLRVMARELTARRSGDASGRVALQGRYGVLNDGEGWRAALMAGAFDLFNHVKPLGREALKFSVGLKGNGMAFTRPLLQQAPFSGSSITEDIDYGLDLLLHHGVRVGYVPGALVRAQMPVTASQAKSQRERWENGRYRLMRERVPGLLAGAVRRGDPRLADTAIDLLLPPLAEMAGLLTLWTVVVVLGAATHRLMGPPALWAALVGAVVVGFVAYVLGGFRVSGAPSAAYAALLKAPAYAVWKLALYAAKPFARRRGASVTAAVGGDEWVRTERVAIPVASSPVEEGSASQ